MCDTPGDNAASHKEQRLDELREEAAQMSPDDAAAAASSSATQETQRGYYGQPVLKPPVWTWEVPVYFFVGGLAGMAAVIALAGLLTGESADLVQAALWLAVGGAVVSPLLLVSDLGRPARFLNMLRVFKWRSPMSVGVWTLVLFSAAVVAAAVLFEIAGNAGLLHLLMVVALAVAAVSGAVLATYTGVLLGATVIPAWTSHHRMLPVHFGVAGLGSAAAALELLGFLHAALWQIGLVAAALETALGLWLEVHRHGAADRALREGWSGLLLRKSVVLAGPVTFVLRLTGPVQAAAVSFLAGILLNRFGWVQAGRASAENPEAVYGKQHPGRA